MLVDTLAVGAMLVQMLGSSSRTSGAEGVVMDSPVGIGDGLVLRPAKILSPLPEPEVESFFFRLESMVRFLGRLLIFYCTITACGEFTTSRDRQLEVPY